MIKLNISNVNTEIFVNESIEGESIEEKVDRIVNNLEPIKDGAPILYTDRKDGVLPQFDVRTDRWDIAIEAMDKASKSIIASREERINAELKAQEDVTKGESTQDADKK